MVYFNTSFVSDMKINYVFIQSVLPNRSLHPLPNGDSGLDPT